jgi:hypothetical protein
MKRLLALIAGIAIGAFATRQIQENPSAKRAFEEAKSSANDFRDALVDGYKKRETELTKPKPAAKKSPTAAKKTTGPKNKPSSK